MMGERLWNKLDSLQTEIKNLKTNMISTTIFTTDTQDTSFLNLLPISSIQKLNDCENMLNNDNTSIKDKLVCSYC